MSTDWIWTNAPILEWTLYSEFSIWNPVSGTSQGEPGKQGNAREFFKYLKRSEKSWGIFEVLCCTSIRISIIINKLIIQPISNFCIKFKQAV